MLVAMTSSAEGFARPVTLRGRAEEACGAFSRRRFFVSNGTCVRGGPLGDCDYARGRRELSQLMDENARYRLLVEAITDYAVYMLDEDGRVVSWNPGAERFKGYRTEEILGRHFSCFYTPEDRAVDLPARALAIAAAEGRFEQEGWRLRKTGERFWAHVVIDPIRGGEGRLIGYAKVTRDLTERRRAAEDLRRSQEQFQILVDGVTDYAIYMLDPGGRVSSWNSGAQRIKGYQPQEIIGAHFSRFYSLEDRANGAPEQALEVAGREGRFEKEGWRLRKDGSRFWAHVVVDAIRGEDGGLIGYAKVTRDITERVEAQRALEKTREALFQSKKLEAIGELTGGIAHDFNNLLAAILGSLDLVRKRLPHDPRISPLLDNAVLGAERGAQLTRRMLAFARKQELRHEIVDLGARLPGQREFLQGLVGADHELRLALAPDLEAVRTDPVQLDAAVVNLVVNARDAMPAGGRIEISAMSRIVGIEDPFLAPGAYVRLSVTDHGEGMDAETAARAMEPFFTTKGVGRGTGLGLSMVHGLMLQSGGRLEIQSEKGAGSVVSLWLPRAVGQTEGLRPVAEDPQLPQALRLRVLAVDDDPLVLTNTVAMLEELGHVVTAASSAGRALELLTSGWAVDLLITDHIMPVMTGADLLEKVRLSRPDLPGVLATGYAEAGTAAEGGGPARLAKPFTLEDLKRAIHHAME